MRSIFLDLDDTILDFRRAERQALSRTLEHFRVAPAPAVLDRYHELNRRQWELLEEGKLTRPQVLVRRFQLLFDELGVRADPEAVCQRYEEQLAQATSSCPAPWSCWRPCTPSTTCIWPPTAPPRSRTAASKARASPGISETSSSPSSWGPTSPARPSSRPASGPSRTSNPAEALMVGDSLTSDIRAPGTPASGPAGTIPSACRPAGHRPRLHHPRPVGAAAPAGGAVRDGEKEVPCHWQGTSLVNIGSQALPHFRI